MFETAALLLGVYYLGRRVGLISGDRVKGGGFVGGQIGVYDYCSILHFLDFGTLLLNNECEVLR